MVCARFRDALSELAAGGPTSAPLEAHLAACATCRAELATLRQVLAMADHELAQLAVAEPSSTFVPRLRAAAMASRDAAVPRASWLWPSLATAVAVVLICTVIVIDRAPEITAVIDTLPPTAPAKTPLQEPAPEAVVASGVDKVAAATAPRRSAVRNRHGEPQVLVPPAESRALVEWVALLNRERRASVALIAADERTARVAPPNSIEIQPIEIVPLDSVMNAGT